MASHLPDKSTRAILLPERSDPLHRVSASPTGSVGVSNATPTYGAPGLFCPGCIPGCCCAGGRCRHARGGPRRSAATNGRSVPHAPPRDPFPRPPLPDDCRRARKIRSVAAITRFRASAGLIAPVRPTLVSWDSVSGPRTSVPYIGTLRWASSSRCA